MYSKTHYVKNTLCKIPYQRRNALLINFTSTVRDYLKLREHSDNSSERVDLSIIARIESQTYWLIGIWKEFAYLLKITVQGKRGTKFFSENIQKLKSATHLPKTIICFNESPLKIKIIKNTFYFILKALFFLKILKFLFSIYVHEEKTALLERWA